MLTKARKFMRENGLILKEKKIEDTIKRCREKIFFDTEGSRRSNTPNSKNSISNLKITVNQNLKEHSIIENSSRQQSFRESNESENRPITLPKKLRHPHQNFSNASQYTDKEVKKETRISLQKNNFQKVLITHVESKHSCYVTPIDNISYRNSVMAEVCNFAETGKETEELKQNMTYACNYENAW